MATRADMKYGVTITPTHGGPILVIVNSSSAAAGALVSMINENSDAKATNDGAIYELPMIISAATADDRANVIEQMVIDFSRVLEGRKLLELRDLTFSGDDVKPFWTATALWTHAERFAEPVSLTEER